MTNVELAKGIGMGLTTTRNKLYELGLQQIEMEYWTPEQIEYLRENYKTKGDVELAEIFEAKWPKNKKWVKQHINKKRKYLKLLRTPEEIAKIASANSSPGGKSYTIDKNSCGINLHPVWVAQRIAWRDPEMQQELLKDKDLIEAATTMFKLKRKIKEIKSEAVQKNIR